MPYPSSSTYPKSTTYPGVSAALADGLLPSESLLPSTSLYPGLVQTVSVDLEMPYAMGGSTGVDFEMSWALNQAVHKDLAMPWEVYELATVDLDLPYDVLGSVGVSLEMSWDIYLLPHFERAPGTHLTWELCDLTGTRLAWIRQRTAASVEVALNEQHAASVSVSLEDTEALSVLQLASLLRVKMDGAPLFTGTIVTPKFNSESNAVEVRAFDPLWRLKEKAQVGMKSANFGLEGAVPGRPWRLEGVEQSEILLRLIRHAFPTNAEGDLGVPHLGVMTGSFNRQPGPTHTVLNALGQLVQFTEPATKLRDREYEWGKSIGEALIEMTAVIGGPDIEFKPLDESVYLAEDQSGAYTQRNKGWRHWQFNTYKPGMGRDRTFAFPTVPKVQFEYNTGRSNVTQFAYEPDGLVVSNRAIAQGQAIEGLYPAQTRTNQPQSALAYGIYSHAFSQTDIIYATTLKEMTDEYVAAHAFAPGFIDFVPAQADGSGFERNPQTGELQRSDVTYGQPFIFGPGGSAIHDFWLGDTISIVGRFGAQPDGTWAVDENRRARVTDAVIEEVEGGNAHVAKITCAPEISYAGVY